MIHAFSYLCYLIQADYKYLQRFKWVGNIASYIAALTISVSIAASLEIWPFLLYMVGNVIWLMAALVIQPKDWPLAWMQIFFLSINSYAILLRAS